MDLKHPLRSIVPSLDWAVLEVLSGIQSGMGASQIARLSQGGSRSGQATILERLVRHGLVVAEPANHGFLYRLNRDHLLAPAILLATGLRTQLLELLASEVAALTPAPVHASVFGSFARGEGDAGSDIDLLVLSASESDTAAWEDQISGLQERLERRTGNRCACMIFSVDRVRQFATDGEPIVENWISDGLLLTGSALALLLDDTVLAPARPRHAARMRSQ